MMKPDLSIADYVTLGRIALVPFLVSTWYFGGSWAGLLTTTLFVLAALSDWLDGWLARRLHVESDFGAFIDPVADKILVAAMLVLIIDRADSMVVTIAGLLIVTRELVVSALRDWMARQGQVHRVAVNFEGKLKTTLQLIAIGILCFALNADWLWLEYLGIGLLLVAAAMSLSSMWGYLRAAGTADN